MGARISGASISALAAAAVAALVVSAALPAAASAGDGFVRAPTRLAGERAVDVGVIDPGANGRLAPFTLNHKYRSSLVLGNRDMTARLGLSPGYGFPGLEYLGAAPPPMSAPGLYLHITASPPSRNGAVLHLRASGVPAAGRLVFNVRERDLGKATASSATLTRGAAAGRPRVDFSIEPGGHIDLVVRHVDAPISVRDVSTQAFVGALAVPAGRPSFDLTLRDRHSYATGDFNDDGRQDIFIASGGLGGDIADPVLTGVVEDEVMAMRRDGTYGSIGGLSKGTCRGRESAAPDIDGDGLTDIFVGCEGEQPVVYLQGDGFQPRTLPVGGDRYRWANVDGRRDLELLAFGKGRMTVYSRGTSRDYAVRLRGEPTGVPALGDPFGSGKPTLLVPSRHGSTIIRGRRASSPKRWGLPGRSTAAAFVDVDNDGREEVHLADDGFFALHRGSFRRRDDIRLRVGSEQPILNWADLDNDGRRDLIAGEFDRFFPLRIKTTEYRNRRKGGNWLEVDTVDALGAKVVVRAGGRRSVGWVGESEGSRWSDAHRRVYFGLGEARRAWVTVFTQTGRIAERTRTDRILRIG